MLFRSGFKWHPGMNTYVGKDHTIHSRIEGVVHFERSQRSFKLKKKRFIMHVLPKESANRVLRPPPYVFHPELWPERAPNNPLPMNLSIPPRQPRPKQPELFRGKGELVSSPKYQLFIQPTQAMISKRKLPPTMSEQILQRIDTKISKLLDEEIVLKSTHSEEILSPKNR